MALSVRSSSCASRLACSSRSLSGFSSSASFKKADLSGSSSVAECSSSSRSIHSMPPIVAVYGRSSMSWQRFQAHRNSTESTAAVRSVPVQVAHELLKAGHHYLDVRTPEEFAAGHVEGAVNIPFMFKVGIGMNRNLDFITEVSARFNKDDEIVVGCLSGNRSMRAATELLSSGFTGVTDMGGGFKAWIQSSLPVTK